MTYKKGSFSAPGMEPVWSITGSTVRFCSFLHRYTSAAHNFTLLTERFSKMCFWILLHGNLEDDLCTRGNLLSKKNQMQVSRPVS